MMKFEINGREFEQLGPYFHIKIIDEPRAEPSNEMKAATRVIRNVLLEQKDVSYKYEKRIAELEAELENKSLESKTDMILTQRYEMLEAAGISRHKYNNVNLTIGTKAHEMIKAKIAELEAERDHWREQAERVAKERDALQARIDLALSELKKIGIQENWIMPILEGNIKKQSKFTGDCCGNAVDAYLDKKKRIEQLSAELKIEVEERHRAVSQANINAKQRDKYRKKAEEINAELGALQDEIVTTRKEKCEKIIEAFNTIEKIKAERDALILDRDSYKEMFEDENTKTRKLKECADQFIKKRDGYNKKAGIQRAYAQSVTKEKIAIEAERDALQARIDKAIKENEMALGSTAHDIFYSFKDILTEKES